MSRLITVGILALSATFVPLVGAETPKTSASAEPKTHALYLGADVSVQVQGTLYPVTGVQGASLIVNKDGKPCAVPLIRKPVAIKVVNVLRLGRNDVELTGLKVERAYTPNRDPRKKFETALVPVGNPGLDMVNAQLNYEAAMKAASGINARDHTTAIQLYAKAAQDRDTALNNAQMDQNYTMHYQQQLQRELSQELYDAMDIRFVVSSARLLPDAYAVGVAQIRERDAKPGDIRYWIVAKGLDAIGPEPRAIQLFDGGLPEGYELVSFQLHLYDGGVEAATPVAAKRVPLSADEAYQFVLLEHLSQHKHDSVPAALAIANVPPPLRARLQGDARTYYVKVSKDGRASAVYSDAGCTEPIAEPELLDALKATRFKPALNNGAPIEGVAPVKLKQLL